MSLPLPGAFQRWKSFSMHGKMTPHFAFRKVKWQHAKGEAENVTGVLFTLVAAVDCERIVKIGQYLP